MPLPSPTKGENREDFMQRCMAEATKGSMTNDQCVAACERQFDDRNQSHHAADWLRAPVFHEGVGVDRERNILRGYVVAQAGPFKTSGRGEFDETSLKKIVALANKSPAGLKSRLAHPTLSSDGIGKFLGRVKNPRMDSVRVRRNGKNELVSAVRGDLHFDKTALEEPVGGGKPLGIYVMDLAESDPDALSSSLVLKSDQEMRLDAKKRPLADEKGTPLPPLWRPTELHASDVVDTGEAVDGILAAELSAAGLPDELVRQASDLLNKTFPGQSVEVVRHRLHAWVDSYLAYRFGDEGEREIDKSIDSPTLDGKVAALRVFLAEQKAL